MSGSVTGERLDHLRSAGRAVLDGLQKADQAQLLTFGQQVVRRQARTGNVALVREALDGARPAGDTSLYDGAFAATMLGESGDGRNLVLLFSDGVDTSSWLSADQALTSARRANVGARAPATRWIETQGSWAGHVARPSHNADLTVRSYTPPAGR